MKLLSILVFSLLLVGCTTTGPIDAPLAPDPDLDTDGDGLPDCWEVQNGLDPLDDGTTNIVNGAEGDLDGDGFNNALEYEQQAPANNPAWNGEQLCHGLMHATVVIVTNTPSVTTNLTGMREYIDDSENGEGTKSQ